MLALQAAARVARPATRHIRQFHVENHVNNNFPFEYEGPSKVKFTAGLIGLFGLGAVAPFLAAGFQLSSQGGSLNALGRQKSVVQELEQLKKALEKLRCFYPSTLPNDSRFFSSHDFRPLLPFSSRPPYVDHTSMLVASSRRVLLPLRASVRSARGYRVENKVGQNFPFGAFFSSMPLASSSFFLFFPGVLACPASSRGLPPRSFEGYDGTSRARFAAAYWGLLVGVGFFGVPGLAWWLQTGKFKGTL
ncbi:hypothetical protein JCM11641_004355 [Rhodosporidiobolus odoratus]